VLTSRHPRRTTLSPTQFHSFPPSYVNPQPLYLPHLQTPSQVWQLNDLQPISRKLTPLFATHPRNRGVGGVIVNQTSDRGCLPRATIGSRVILPPSSPIFSRATLPFPGSERVWFSTFNLQLSTVYFEPLPTHNSSHTTAPTISPCFPSLCFRTRISLADQTAVQVPPVHWFGWQTGI
jgi:hypothetical protein